MNFLNLGIGEILFILVIALIIFGPGNLVKTAREMGAFIRKVAKSPYWQEVWATKRELSELPKLISKEAHLDETIEELQKETKGLKSTLSSSVSDFIKGVNQPNLIDSSKEESDSRIRVSIEEATVKNTGDTHAETTDSKPVKHDNNEGGV
jgi:Sec-independent protein translocase protein TatA